MQVACSRAARARNIKRAGRYRSVSRDVSSDHVASPRPRVVWCGVVWRRCLGATQTKLARPAAATDSPEPTHQNPPRNPPRVRLHPAHVCYHNARAHGTARPIGLTHPEGKKKAAARRTQRHAPSVPHRPPQPLPPLPLLLRLSPPPPPAASEPTRSPPPPDSPLASPRHGLRSRRCAGRRDERRR